MRDDLHSVAGDGLSHDHNRNVYMKNMTARETIRTAGPDLAKAESLGVSRKFLRQHCKQL
jgi:hypothetical protein